MHHRFLKLRMAYERVHLKDQFKEIDLNPYLWFPKHLLFWSVVFKAPCSNGPIKAFKTTSFCYSYFARLDVYPRGVLIISIQCKICLLIGTRSKITNYWPFAWLLSPSFKLCSCLFKVVFSFLRSVFFFASYITILCSLVKIFL